VRIVLVDTYYPAFVDQHYAESPGLAGRPYGEQLGSLMDRFFGTSDAYSRHLSELGHDAVDIVANCVSLQSRWAAEHGRPGLLRRVAARLPRLPERGGRSGFLRDVAIAHVEDFGAELF
jgi:spore maturation protein CgeB